jgi:thioredoxin-related protein
MSQMNMLNTIKLAGTLLLLTVLGCQSKTQGTETATEQQAINPNEVTWETDINAALQKAKSSNKILFVECYSPTCPVCQKLEPFFKKPEVAKIYNSNFINFKLDVGNAELVKFLNQRNIFLPSFPQFLFFDGDGKLLHQAEVNPDIPSFELAANTAKSPDKRSSSYPDRFKAGERSLDFLTAYASYARVSRDTAANLAAAAELFKAFPQKDLGSELSWKLTKKCVSDIDNGFAKYWFDHASEAAAIEIKEGHDGNEKNILGGIIQSSLYSPRGQKYGTDKINLIKQYMGKAGAAQYADGVTWEFETKALIREGKAAGALNIGKKMAAMYGSNGQSLVYITKVFNDVYPDASYSVTAKGWMQKAKPLIKENNALAEYYYESARLNQKTGDKVTAKTEALQALNLATTAKVNLQKFNLLVSSL